MLQSSSGGGVLLGRGVLLGPRGVSAWSGGGRGSPWSRAGYLPGLGGFPLCPGGVCLFQGDSPWSRGVSACSRGGSREGSGGVLLGPGGLGASAWSGGDSPETPPMNRITDTCKNITLATTSLRPVIKNKSKAEKNIEMIILTSQYRGKSRFVFLRDNCVHSLP